MKYQDIPGWEMMTPQERQKAMLAEMWKDPNGTPLNYGTFPDPHADTREWWVTHCTYRECWIILACRNTGAEGAIKDSTQQEWNQVLEAPYRWEDASRVVLMKEGRQ